MTDQTKEMIDRIEDTFTYHSLNDGQVAKCELLRAKAKVVAYAIEGACPSSREKSLAMTKLEEAIMWANAAIARN